MSRTMFIGTDLYYSQEFVDDRISELKEKDKEIERLKTELQDTKEHLGEYLHEQEEENNRLNNIINELLKKIQFYKTTEWGLRGYGILENFENILNGDDVKSDR